ncbi:MAG TPA: CBS domain-containing protein [Actinomycetes bacterium]|jgi:CBS-domain-containing membrane protein|nr:CBS domain-containing protein [Actinomycetes bacterium]
MTLAANDVEALDRLLGTVGEAMTPDVLVLPADMQADIAVRALERSQVSGAPVVDRGHVIGVVTLGDMLATSRRDSSLVRVSGPFLRQEHVLGDLRVWQLMTSGAATARASWPLTRAVTTMHEAGVNRLPVVDDRGRPVGIIARADVLRAIAQRAQAGRGRDDRSVAEPEHRPQMPPD